MMFKKLMIRGSAMLSRFVGELAYIKARITGNVAKPEAFEALLEKVKNFSPEQFNDYIKSNFTYEADGIDYSDHPLMFLRTRKGDCDDFANLCGRLLERMGYAVYLTSVFADVKRGHAVCVASKDGKTYGFGNWALMRFSSSDFVTVGREICLIGYNSQPEFIIKFNTKWKWLDFYHV